MRFIKLFTTLVLLTVASAIWVFVEFAIAWAKPFNYISIYVLIAFFVSLVLLASRDLYIAFINRNN